VSAVRVRRIITGRGGGRSTGPYAAFNLGGAVGDDPKAVAANRSRLASAAGLTPDRVVWMRQVHGTTIRTVTDGAADTADTDGIVTTTTGLGLAVLVADCVPLLAADPAGAVIGAAHAGRKGAAAGIDRELLATMVRSGAAVGRIEVLVGPAICGACYEVPAEMRDEIEVLLPGSATTTRSGTPGLDLRAGLVRSLRAAGVAGVKVDPRCTLEDPALYSHRRGAPTGRQVGLIWLDASDS